MPTPTPARRGKVGAEKRCGDDGAAEEFADFGHPNASSHLRTTPRRGISAVTRRLGCCGRCLPRLTNYNGARRVGRSTVLGGSAVFEAANALLAKLRGALGFE